MDNFRCGNKSWGRGAAVPATSQTPDEAAGPRPQNISEDVRLVTGLLSLTVRTQVPALSSVPTQSSCQVEWAETVAAAARSTVAYFILKGADEMDANKVNGVSNLLCCQTPALPSVYIYIYIYTFFGSQPSNLVSHPNDHQNNLSASYRQGTTAYIPDAPQAPSHVTAGPPDISAVPNEEQLGAMQCKLLGEWASCVQIEC